MANENNKIKLLLLWDILSKNTDENHAMNADEIREELAKRGISVMRKVIADDIAVLNEYGYEVLRTRFYRVGKRRQRKRKAVLQNAVKQQLRTCGTSSYSTTLESENGKYYFYAVQSRYG